MSKILACAGISKSFIDGDKNIMVLRHIDLLVQPGEMLAIVGSSGCGKSTLLQILAGLEQPTAGRVLLNNEDYSQLSAARKSYLRNTYLGFVYQFHHLLAEFSALENVAMPLLLAGKLSLSAINDKAAAVLTAVGLQDRLQHKPAQLSGGERQRVAIARAIVTEPVCILADEPTGNLDPENADRVLHLLLGLQTMLQLSLIIVTHDQKIARKAQRAFTIQNGYLIPC
jgi:lipoprotein-releasing system ATP-binding protein